MNPPQITKPLMKMIALLLSTAIIPTRPACSPADWEFNGFSPDDPNYLPDLMLGTHNDWWLRSTATFDNGGFRLWIQARYGDLDKMSVDYAKRVLAMFQLGELIERELGVHINFPWSFDDFCVAAGHREKLTLTVKDVPSARECNCHAFSTRRPSTFNFCPFCGGDMSGARFSIPDDELSVADYHRSVKLPEGISKIPNLSE